MERFETPKPKLKFHAQYSISLIKTPRVAHSILTSQREAATESYHWAINKVGNLPGSEEELEEDLEGPLVSLAPVTSPPG